MTSETIFAFGDDHARSAFARCANVTLHWFGPYTLHRIGDDGAFANLQLVLPKLEAEFGGTMIYMLGAEDVRRHLVRQAVEEGQPLPDLIRELAERYVDRLHWLTTLVIFPLKLCVVGVVPPVSPKWDDQSLPALGSFQERRTARELLNDALQARCRERGVAYVRIPEFYETTHGALRPHLSDGRGHIATDQARHLCAAVGQAVDADLGAPRLGALARLRRQIARARAIRAGDAAALSELGRTE